MTSHELARKLLAAPDLPVVTWDAYGDSETDEVQAVVAYAEAKVYVGYPIPSVYGEGKL